jgi:hypothetical protein
MPNRTKYILLVSAMMRGQVRYFSDNGAPERVPLASNGSVAKQSCNGDHTSEGVATPRSVRESQELERAADSES